MKILSVWVAFFFHVAAGEELRLENAYDWWMKNDVPSTLPTTTNTNDDWPVYDQGGNFVCESCQFMVRKLRNDTTILVNGPYKHQYGGIQLAAEQATLPALACKLETWEEFGNKTQVFWGAHMQRVCVKILGDYRFKIQDVLMGRPNWDSLRLAVCVKFTKYCAKKDLWPKADFPESLKLQAQRHGEMGAKFMAENLRDPKVTSTSEGMQMKVVTKGKLDTLRPSSGSTVTFEYNGTFLNGITFDSTEKRGGPISGAVAEILPAIRKGMMNMGVGGDTIFYVPPKLGFGDSGKPFAVNGNMTLIFRIRLLDVQGPQAEEEDFEDVPLPELMIDKDGVQVPVQGFDVEGFAAAFAAEAGGFELDPDFDWDYDEEYHPIDKHDEL